MSLYEKFGQAVKAVSDLKSRPSETDIVELYGLYKQSIVGDVNTAKPTLTDVKRKARWDAWSSKKGVSQDAAREQYIAKATALGAL